MKKLLVSIVFSALLITGTFLASCDQEDVQPIPEIKIPVPELPEETQHFARKERGITIKN